MSTELLIAPTGEASDDQFGFSVARAGDVNGDGFGDVIVGAYLNDAAGTNAGRVYVYFGGPGADTTADLTFTGQAAGDFFGQSVGTAGDVNGDGFADLIVGAPWADPDGMHGGGAYLFYGGPAADTTADLTFAGEASQDLFGESVGTAGDVNGDGFADLIVGASQNDGGGSDAGRAYVYYGGPGADSTADLTLTGEAAGDWFGFSVGTAGDVNGDGFDDVIAGAFLNDAGGGATGRAYVYFGGAAADSFPDLTLTGQLYGEEFGYSVGTAGDVNGDGFGDVIVGAYSSDAYGIDAGRAYVYYGASSADNAADLILTGAAAGDNFGVSVGTGGDVNGDGFADLIVGAYHNSSGGLSVGRAYVYYGGSSGPDSTADVTLTGEASGDLFGISVGTAGDVNGDSSADLIIGAYTNDAVASNAGRAYVFSVSPYRVLTPNGGEQWVVGEMATVRWKGPDRADLAFSPDGGVTYSILQSGVGGSAENEMSIPVPAMVTGSGLIRLTYQGQTPTRFNSDASDAVFRIVEPSRAPAAAHRLELTLDGEAAGDLFGTSVGGAGDVNGDGFADLIVGAQSNAAGGAGAGRAYVYLGGATVGATPYLTLTGAAADDFFGYSAGTAGDVNGDGFDDVVVGAYGSDAGGADAGRAYVYFGGVGADTTADLTLTGEVADDWFGYSVGTAGDVNGDGFADVIVGAYGSDVAAVDAGRAYVFYGGLTPDATPDLYLDGEAALDYFGISVGTAGDVNGDGFDDLVVGADQNDGGGVDAGRAYVYYGGPGADATADLVLTGEAANDRFGRSVGTAGDVNGDGFADVIVGARLNDAGGTSAGRAYVYYGGPGAGGAADLVLTGEAVGDHLSRSVGTAGDVNGDGFDDLLVGANLNDAMGTSAGRVYVYYGGPGADAMADLVLTGEAAGDHLGTSVGAAGDVNGDGFADFIIGAESHDGNGVDAGRAYVHVCNRYFVTSPTAGATWNVGATETVSWLGAEPADVSLSVDGGGELVPLATSVGGKASNDLRVLVPHYPTRFARVRVSPHDASVPASGSSDSLFTIDASIVLLSFQASFREGTDTEAVITWQTDPEPEDLTAYRLARSAAGSGWRTLVETTETRYVDAGTTAGSRYRLTAINGLGEAYLLGETALGMVAPLAAWPVPYRSGDLHVTFATLGGLGGGTGGAEVTIYDIAGRRVRTVVRGDFEAGQHSVTWDGLDDHGRMVSTGVYFVRVDTAGNVRSQKLVVLR